MLVRFNVKNHKSIAGELSIDFSAATSLQDNRPFVVDDHGLRLLPVAALYGNNASGKTNILDALIFMVSGVISSGIEPLPKNWRAAPFAFRKGTSGDSESSYEVFLLADGKEYQYGFAVTDDKITGEWLYARKAAVKTDTVWRMIFIRGDSRYSYGNKKYEKIVKAYEPLIDDRLLVLSFIALRDINGVDDFKVVRDRLTSIFPSTPDAALDDVAYSFYDHNPELLDSASEFIRAFDPMFETLEFVSRTQDDGTERRVAMTRHRGALYPVHFESGGTERMLAVLIGLYTVLNEGGIYVVDELDCKLHPLIVRKIVRMFHDRAQNKHRAQLLFSSHNLIVLDSHDLRRDEIWFVEKDDEGRTTVSSLADFIIDSKRFRADMNYSKNYLAGVFGAIPFQSRKE